MMILGLSLLLIVCGAVIAAQGKRLAEEEDYSASLNEALEEAHREVLMLRDSLKAKTEPAPPTH